MHISNEGLLTQLGYNPQEANIKMLHIIQEHTPGFEQIKRHIVALHDHLKNYGGYVAISSSQPYFKIKIDTDEPTSLRIATDEIHKWADKYNVKLQKVVNKETYYIVGIEK